MTISGNVNSASILVVRARAGGHDPVFVSAKLAGDGNDWPAGLVVTKQEDGEYAPWNTAETKTIDAGDGTAKTFTGNLGKDITPGSVTVSDGTEAFTDDGFGALTGDADGTGKVNYKTGDVSVTFNAAPANEADIDAGMKHEPNGVLDEKKETAADTTAHGLVIVHGTVKNDLLQTNPASLADASDAVKEKLTERTIWAV